MDALTMGENFARLLFSAVAGSDDSAVLAAQTAAATAAALLPATGEHILQELGHGTKRKLDDLELDPPSLNHVAPPRKPLSAHRGRVNRWGVNYAAQLLFLKDAAFLARVGVARATFDDLRSRIAQVHEQQSRRPEPLLRTRLLMTIVYLTSHKIYRQLSSTFGYSEAAVSRLVYRTVTELNSLSADAIRWPAELNAAAQAFHRVARFPGTLGALGVTHLVARAPEKAHLDYRNAHGKFSIILLAITDASSRFTYVSVGYPGALSSEKCLANADISSNLDKLPNDYLPEKRFHLVADDSFHLREGLMVPYAEPKTDAEVAFNQSLLDTQATTRNTFSSMKNRFQTLTKLDMNIERVVEFTTACCILHNVCIENGDVWPADVDPAAADAEPTSPLEPSPELSPAAELKRDLFRDQIFLGLT